jgi:hypothetical protein
MLRAMSYAVVSLAVVVGLADVAAAQTTPIDRTASRQARERQRDAQLEFNRRNATVRAITARMKADFEQRNEWIKAQADLKAAQAAHEAARKPVLAALAKKPEYRKALEAKQKAEAERDALATTNSRSSDKLYEAAGKAIDANFIVVKMENDALAADPNVQQTLKQLNAAQDAVAALNKQFEQELETSLEWVEAKKLAEESQLVVAEATKALQDATKQEAEQMRQQRESARQSRRGSSGRSY